MKGENLFLASDSLSTFPDPLSALPSSECSLIVAHGQLEQLIREGQLEEWNRQKGIVEEEAEAFLDEGSRL